MKHIQDKINGQAWIVLDKKKNIAARVHALYTKAGVVHVGIYDYIKSHGKPGAGYQTGSAGGYGYDKLTAAMRGLVIDGVKLTDHCETDKNTERILKNYIKAHDNANDHGPLKESIDGVYFKKAKKIGACFANYSPDKGRYNNLYLKSGLDKLQMLGYTVYQAL
jgi:hypothetical protein